MLHNEGWVACSNSTWTPDGSRAPYSQWRTKLKRLVVSLWQMGHLQANHIISHIPYFSCRMQCENVSPQHLNAENLNAETSRWWKLHASCLKTNKNHPTVTAFKKEKKASVGISSGFLLQLLWGKALVKFSVKPSFQLKRIYFCLKPCKQGYNSLLHHWITVCWLWGEFLARPCVMLVQWNLVLRAEGKCPLARRCAQNLKTDDRPACVRP